ncbi:D-alanyl-D-alanine carboxypeptidase family protein [Oryzobacter sp. R7]|uniref:D-alanyl-D-alanine carboxypeptidase family protein n=1 Tax=Oryzobacter faecalis TaxID=3388656 RepID=UPI00398CCCE1
MSPRRHAPLTATAVLTAAAAVAALAAAPAPAATTAGVPTVAAPAISRLAGADRYATSVAASKAAFPTGSTAPVVHLVSGTSMVDGYSSIPGATARGGAMLLTRPDGIPSVVAAELDRLNPSRIIVVGNTSTLSPAVASAAARYAPTVTRVSGDSRMSTSRAVNRTAFTSASRAWVVTGTSHSDAVAGAIAAAGHRAPLLVVQGTKADLDPADATLLRDLGVGSVTIVGGTGAVSAGIGADLAALLGSGNVTRASGSDRYDTSAKVNALAWPSMTAGTAYLADGYGLVDAFAGAPLAGHQRRPLYYTVPYCVPAAVRPALTGPAVTRVTLLGGEAVVRVLAGRLEACRSIDSASSLWVLVNKRNAISPRTYAPSGLVVPSMPYANGHRLRSDAAAALSRMAAASNSEGAGRFGIDTAYRSYETQKALYDKYLALKGRTWTDTWYMRPGYSEHQTGLAVDLLPIGRSNCTINDCIDETPQGVWLARNSWRFGYLLRYEKGRTSVTGMGFEPWHFRYVGLPLAKAYRDAGWHTYEQFLGEPPAPTY